MHQQFLIRIIKNDEIQIGQLFHLLIFLYLFEPFYFIRILLCMQRKYFIYVYVHVKFVCTCKDKVCTCKDTGGKCKHEEWKEKI